jgi:hypothetical protein
LKSSSERCSSSHPTLPHTPQYALPITSLLFVVLFYPFAEKSYFVVVMVGINALASNS